MRRGFTLMEVLCVIAILSALAGLIFPVFQGAKKRGYVAQSLGNSRSQALGILLYCGDNDERFPFATDDFSKTFPWLEGPDEPLIASMPLYNQAIGLYVPSAEAFRSPFDTGTTVTENGGLAYIRKPSLFQAVGSSYSYMVAMGMHMTSIQAHLESFPMIRSAAGHWECGCPEITSDEGSPQRDPIKATGYRYEVAFGDGHVRNLAFFQWWALGDAGAVSD